MPYKQNPEYYKKYVEENKEKVREKNRKWRLNNKEHILQQSKEYRQTDQCIKSVRIGHWKNRGVIHDNFDELYEYYINCKECENCGIELIEGMYGANKRCLDHCHKTGKFRNILCNSCNFLRKEDNF